MSDDKAQAVRQRAYQLWQEQGEPDGLHLDHWLQAEQELAEDSSMEGEGSRTAARAYDQAATEFAHSGKVEEAAREAVEALSDPAKAAELRKAEATGKKRRRGEDPAP